MNNTLTLFDKINTCSKVMRFMKDKNNNKEYVSSYEKVMQHLPQSNEKVHGNTDVVKALLQYLKQWFVQRGTDDRKSQIAMYVSLLMADDQDKTVLTEQICQHFRRINDFDRAVMLKIFQFSISNDRVSSLLDKTTTLKTKDIGTAIELEFNVEFVLIFFSVMEKFVLRENTLTCFGYVANVSSSVMADAREIIDQQVENIATKCSPCFKKNVLKPPREQSNLFPAGGAFPYVSIGRVPVNYDNKLSEGELQKKLQESLIDKPEKKEFLEILFAAISYASNNDPIATLRGIKLDSVKEFFLKKVLDKDEEEETRKAILASDEARELYQKVESLEKKISSLNEELSSVKENFSSEQQKNSYIEDIYRKLVKENPILKEEKKELKQQLKCMKDDLSFEKMEVENLRQELTKKKRKRSPKEKNDLIWHKSHIHQHNYSGDEEE